MSSQNNNQITNATSSLGVGGFSFSRDNLENLLELTPDAYYKDAVVAKVEVPTAIAKMDLDITRISNRLLVMSRCWTHRSDKDSHRNNIDELSLFLNTR